MMRRRPWRTSSPARSCSQQVRSRSQHLKCGALTSGFGLCGTAETLIEALKAHPHINELTGVSNNAGDGVFGLAPLVKSGQIKKMVLSYVGTNKNMQDAYLRGDTMLELSPQGTIAERLRAAAAGMPGFYTRTGAGESAVASAAR